MAGEEDDDLTINIDAELDGGAADGMDDLASKAQAAADAADALKSSLDDVGSADVSGLSDSLDEVAGKEQDAADAADALKTSLDDVADADLGGVADALDEVTQKEQDAADAAKAYAAELDAAGEGGQTLADMAASLESVTEAADGAGEALAEVAKAEDDAASAGGGLDDAGKPLDDMAASAGKAADEMDRAAAAEKELLAGESPFEQGGGSGGAAGGGAAQGDQSGGGGPAAPGDQGGTGGASGGPGGQVDWPAVLNQPGAQRNAASGTAQAAQGGAQTQARQQVAQPQAVQSGGGGGGSGGTAGGGDDGNGPGAANGYMGSMRTRRGLNMLMGRQGAQFSQAYMGLSGQYGAAGIAGGGITAFDTIGQGLAKTLDTLGNSSMSADAKVRTLVEGLPVVGQLASMVFSLTDAFTGLSETLRQNAQDLAQNQYLVQIESKMDTDTHKVDMTLAKDQATLDAVTSIMPNYGNAPDPVSDPVGYQRWTQSIPLVQKQADAQRKVAVASATIGARQDSVASLQDKIAADQNKADAAKAAFDKQWASSHSQGQGQAGPRGVMGWMDEMSNGPTTGAAADKAALDTAEVTALTAQNQLLSDQAQLRQQLNELAGNQLELTQAASEERKAQIALDQQQLGILQQQENMARSQYEAIGGMDVNQRQNVLQALQQADEAGFETLSSNQKQLIGQAGGQAYLKEQYLQQAQQDDTTQQIRQYIGGAGGGSTDSLDQIAADKVQLQQQINIEVQADAELIAQAVKDQVDPVWSSIKVLISKVAENETVNKTIEFLRKLGAQLR